jgi:hypothetical protein
MSHYNSYKQMCPPPWELYSVFMEFLLFGLNCVPQTYRNTR